MPKYEMPELSEMLTGIFTGSGTTQNKSIEKSGKSSKSSKKKKDN